MVRHYEIKMTKNHGLRTPREEIAFTARPKIQSQSQIFRYGWSIFCLPPRPNFSYIFDLCLHRVSVVCDTNEPSWPAEHFCPHFFSRSALISTGQLSLLNQLKTKHKYARFKQHATFQDWNGKIFEFRYVLFHLMYNALCPTLQSLFRSYFSASPLISKAHIKILNFGMDLSRLY